jgi:hypothetical protein
MDIVNHRGNGTGEVLRTENVSSASMKAGFGDISLSKTSKPTLPNKNEHGCRNAKRGLGWKGEWEGKETQNTDVVSMI